MYIINPLSEKHHKFKGCILSSIMEVEPSILTTLFNLSDTLAKKIDKINWEKEYNQKLFCLYCEELNKYVLVKYKDLTDLKYFEPLNNNKNFFKYLTYNKYNLKKYKKFYRLDYFLNSYKTEKLIDKVIKDFYGDLFLEKQINYNQSLGKILEYIIKVPDFYIKNSSRKHFIKGLYLKIEFNIENGIVKFKSLKGFRRFLTPFEDNAGYAHSHLSGVPSTFQAFCLGNSAVGIARTFELSDDDEEYLETLFFNIENLLKIEDTSNPYNRISRIQTNLKKAKKKLFIYEYIDYGKLKDLIEIKLNSNYDTFFIDLNINVKDIKDLKLSSNFYAIKLADDYYDYYDYKNKLRYLKRFKEQIKFSKLTSRPTSFIIVNNNKLKMYYYNSFESLPTDLKPTLNPYFKERAISHFTLKILNELKYRKQKEVKANKAEQLT
jgi:hypothetical protein